MHKKLFSVIILILVLAFSNTITPERAELVAQAEAPVQTTAPDPQPPAGTAILTGVITAANGGQPIADVEVCAVGHSDGSYHCTQTGANGVYAFSGLPTGNYSVSAFKEGWAFETYGGGTDRDFYHAGHLLLLDGQTLGGINIALDPGGTVSGRVTDAANNPLEGIQVRLSGWMDAYACTDGNGSYTISGIPYEGLGFFVIEAGMDSACPNSLPAYAREFWQDKSDPESSDLIQFTRQAPVLADIDFSLELGGSISGAVTSEADGTPLEGISVCASHYFGEVSPACTLSGVDGTYTIEGLSTFDEYSVKAMADGWAYEYYENRPDTQHTTLIAVTAGMDTPGINFSLEPGGVISGTVTDPDGLPLEGVQVTVGSVITTSDANGQYRIDSVPYGQYLEVRAVLYDENWDLVYAPEFWDDAPYSGNQIWFNSEITERSGIDFELEPLGIISGTVRASSGEVVADQQVCFYGSNVHYNGCGFTDSYGNYSFKVYLDYYSVYTWGDSGIVYYEDPEHLYTDYDVIADNGGEVGGIDLIIDPCFQASDGTQMEEVALDWCVSVGTDTFEVYRTPPGGTPTLIGSTAGTAYTDTGAQPGILYTYQVKACAQGVCSDFSAPDTGWSNTTPDWGEYDDSFMVIGYEGDWDVLSDASYRNGTLHRSQNNVVASATVFFAGRCVNVYYVTQDTYTMGRMRVYIDDELMGEYLQYSEGEPAQAETGQICVDYGVHELKLSPHFSDPINIDGISIQGYRYRFFAPLMP